MRPPSRQSHPLPRLRSANSHVRNARPYKQTRARIKASVMCNDSHESPAIAFLMHPPRFDTQPIRYFGGCPVTPRYPRKCTSVSATTATVFFAPMRKGYSVTKGTHPAREGKRGREREGERKKEREPPRALRARYWRTKHVFHG